MSKIYYIKDDFVNTRLDRWFKKEVCKVPQSIIEKNIRKKKIKVNNKKEKSSYRLQKNDQIFIGDFKLSPNKNIKTKHQYIPTKKDLSFSSNIFIENNDNFAVINKPRGISVQSGTKSKKNVLDILRKTKEFSDHTPFTVHRIDKDTTGILIVAKNRKYAQLFTSLFRIRKIHKTYLCIALGHLDKNKGTFIDQLYHFEGTKKIFTKAITHYEVLNTNYNYSYLKLSPETGRKHQLRKQLLMHGNPILGDSKYKNINAITKKNADLMLHAYSINFSINNEKFKFVAELPELFKKYLKEKNLKSF